MSQVLKRDRKLDVRGPVTMTLASLVLGGFVALAAAADGPLGTWDATLQTPGGDLHFGLVLQEANGKLAGTLRNGPESISVPRCEIQARQLTLEMTHYDSRIEAEYAADQDVWVGHWTKRRSADEIAKLKFVARRSSATPPARTEADERFVGRWRVQFASEDTPAVGVFQHDERVGLWGTFLTAFGDYRYLGGRAEGDQLELSCFDGAHAFLFRAQRRQDGTLEGDFWSGDWWHDTWTAYRDPQAQLPDAFELAKVRGDTPLTELKFADLNGELQPLIDESRKGKPLLIEIFGSWCPNCHDAGAYLAELQEKYEARGLRVLGLAFELTGDVQHDAQQVREYVQLHKIKFPVLIGGISNREEATRQLRILDQVRAYPTILFVNRNGDVSAIYTGFNGPATGDAHVKMREQFTLKLEQMLNP